jgi:chloramphenicol O-acetyltransferase
MLRLNMALNAGTCSQSECIAQRMTYTINHLKTKRRLLYFNTQSVQRSKHFYFGYENQSPMLYGAEVAVCSELNTKQIRVHAVWSESTIMEC